MIHRYANSQCVRPISSDANVNAMPVCGPPIAIRRGQSYRAMRRCGSGISSGADVGSKMDRSRGTSVRSPKRQARNVPEKMALTILARICYEDGDLPRVEDFLESIMRASADCVPLECLIDIYPLMAWLARNGGNSALAVRHLIAGERVGKERRCPRLTAVCLREHIELLVRTASYPLPGVPAAPARSKHEYDAERNRSSCDLRRPRSERGPIVNARRNLRRGPLSRYANCIGPRWIEAIPTPLCRSESV